MLRIPHAGVRILAFSSRGQYLAAAGGSFDTASGVARIWNSTTGVEEAAIAHLENGLPRSPSALAFSPDDETLVTADLEVLLHHWRDAGIKKDACDRLTRNLTKDEWNQFFPGDSYRRTCDNLPPYGEGRLVRTVERVPLFNN